MPSRACARGCACLVLAAAVALAGADAERALWPVPVVSAVGGDEWPLSPAFQFRAAGPGSSSQLLARAFARYRALLFPASGPPPPSPRADSGAAGVLESLAVNVSSADERLFLGVDESYNLKLSGADGQGQLSAPSVFGALRGLETFLQLSRVPGSGRASVPSSCMIQDAPRFQYRGLMSDQSRHFYPLPFLRKMITAASSLRLNVLHLHLTDDQSFPVSTQHTNLSIGAFGPTYTYAASDLAELEAFAQDRGVILVPEFDIPAHSSSWGAANNDSIVVKCSPRPFTHGDTLDPSIDSTFEIIEALMGDVTSDAFPQSEFIHLGGDEVPSECWGNDPAVQAWMKAKGFSNFSQALGYFVSRVASGRALQNHTLMYWEEAFENAPSSMPSTAVIQAWKTNVMPRVIQAGHRVTNSFGWYLNHGCSNDGDGTWEKFYENDPKKYTPGITPEQEHLILGGETTMWSECVDPINFDAIVWLRTAAAAEQLWSPAAATRTASTEVARRLSVQRCRMIELLGVGIAPVDDSSYPRELNPGCQ